MHLPEWVDVGVDCRFAPGVRIGTEGFGYEKDHLTEMWVRRAHTFGVTIGDRVEIGANSVIDRGRWRDTHIGSGTKIDANVFIAHNVNIDEDCLIIAGSSIGGSCNIGHDCWIGIGCTIKDNINIAERTMLGAGAVVIKDIVEPDGVWVGNPAKFLRKREDHE